MSQTPRPWAILLKATLLFLLFDLAFAAFPSALGRFSLYNRFFPGRPRFPFGENILEAHNLSIGDLDALFAAHLLDGTPKSSQEFRILVLGDSSIWGTLLRPEETRTTHWNSAGLTCGDKTLRFYNLGYPTLSLTKDLLILETARRYRPDALIWFVTLESLAADTQLDSPLIQSNAQALRALIESYHLPLDQAKLSVPTFWQRTLIAQRRALADWARLQLLGVIWAATGVDQAYPPHYTPAQRDFSEDVRFHDWQGPVLPTDALTWDLLRAGIEQIAPPRLLLVNEPILIASGKNSHLRYNFYYPRWAYDEYRTLLHDFVTVHELPFVDAWDWIPDAEFTNSAIHLSPHAEAEFAQRLIPSLLEALCTPFAK
ncbi:MAG: hypothetical protein ACK4VW_03165 [Anaerolineales bacterium]